MMGFSSLFFFFAGGRSYSPFSHINLWTSPCGKSLWIVNVSEISRIVKGLTICVGNPKDWQCAGNPCFARRGLRSRPSGWWNRHLLSTTPIHSYWLSNYLPTHRLILALKLSASLTGCPLHSHTGCSFLHHN